MRRLKIIVLFITLGVVLPGCTQKLVEDVIVAFATVPFVDRTEKEVNDWFDNRTIIDDKPMTSGTAINGEPVVLFIYGGPNLQVNETSYPGTLCITQINTLPDAVKVKYSALVGIKVLNNPNLFECGEIEISQTSCDGDPMAVNVAFGRSKAILQKAFRDAVNEWLIDDIVKQLKSSNNKEGFANPSTAQPRLPAKTKGTMYNIYKNKKGTRIIGFFAQ
jgi:hypothetical protein